MCMLLSILAVRLRRLRTRIVACQSVLPLHFPRVNAICCFVNNQVTSCLEHRSPRVYHIDVFQVLGPLSWWYSRTNFSWCPYVSKWIGRFDTPCHKGLRAQRWYLGVLGRRGVIIGSSLIVYHCLNVYWAWFDWSPPAGSLVSISLGNQQCIRLGEVRTALSRKCPFHCLGPLKQRTLSPCPFRFPTDQLLSLDDDLSKILGSSEAPSSSSNALSRESGENNPAAYPSDDADDWDFADLSIDSQIEIRIGFHRYFVAIRKLAVLLTLS